MIEPKNGTEKLFLSITRNCETLIENLKKPSNSKWSNQEKHFILTLQFTLKEIGC